MGCSSRFQDGSPNGSTGDVVAQMRRTTVPTRGGRLVALPRRSAVGHLERFPPERLNGRCRIGQETSAGAYSGDGLAPKGDTPANRQSSARIWQSALQRVAADHTAVLGPIRTVHEPTP